MTIPPDSLRDLPPGRRIKRAGDGLSVSVGVEGGDLLVEASGDPVSGMTYTEELSADRTVRESDRTLEERKAATEPFKQRLNALVVALVLVLIILILKR